jgi:hypothetical protein
MQSRTKSAVLQVCLALVCALGAGFSGEMQARTTGHAGHGTRHVRGNSHRGARADGHDNQSEQTQEFDLAPAAGRSGSSFADHGSPAILSTTLCPHPDWIALASVDFADFVTPRDAGMRRTSTRAPPSLA